MPKIPKETNRTLRCTVAHCSRHRAAWGEYCGHHARQFYYYGHPQATAFPVHLRNVYQAKARGFLEMHRESDPVQAALKVMHDLIYQPAPFLVARGDKPKADLKRLQAHRVDPFNALVAAAAVVICDRQEPVGSTGIPTADIRNQCLPIRVGFEIIRLAPRSETIGARFEPATGSFPDRPTIREIRPTKTSRKVIGDRVMSRLGLFMVHLTAELQRRDQEAQQQHRAEQEALTGAFR